jgi:hypothetical protein
MGLRHFYSKIDQNSKHAVLFIWISFSIIFKLSFISFFIISILFLNYCMIIWYFNKYNYYLKIKNINRQYLYFLDNVRSVLSPSNAIFYCIVKNVSSSSFNSMMRVDSDAIIRLGWTSHLFFLYFFLAKI